MSTASELLQNAIAYCDLKQIGLVEKAKLGFGTDGTVWQTTRLSAVKASERLATHQVEVESYQRLADLGLSELAGFAVPRLLDYDDRLMVIEMSIVEPPYLLDFGKVYLDRPPIYYSDSNLMDQFRDEYRELFEDRWPEVQILLSLLEYHGIYYVDPKPGNIAFGD